VIGVGLVTLFGKGPLVLALSVTLPAVSGAHGFLAAGAVGLGVQPLGVRGQSLPAALL